MSFQQVLHPSLSAVQMNKMHVLQFCVFGCALLGSLMATLATGSRRANAKISSAQQGLRCWIDHLSNHMKLWIMHQGYGNDTATVQKLRNSKNPHEQEFAATHFPGDKEALDPNKFSPRAFLVHIASWIYFNLHWNL